MADKLLELLNQIERDDREKRLTIVLDPPKRRPLPRRLYHIGRVVWNLGVVVLAGAALWGLCTLLFSVDSGPVDHAERHWQVYQGWRAGR